MRRRHGYVTPPLYQINIAYTPRRTIRISCALSHINLLPQIHANHNGIDWIRRFDAIVIQLIDAINCLDFGIYSMPLLAAMIV